MKPVKVKDWVEALRSGDFQQGQEQLRSPDNEYCCLGVLVELAEAYSSNGDSEYYSSPNIDDYDDYDDDPIVRVDQELTGLPLECLKNATKYVGIQGELINMNDGELRTFDEIADFIEKNVDQEAEIRFV